MANVGLHSVLGATRQGSSSTGRTSGGTSSSRSGSAPRSTTVNASTARAAEVTSTTGQRPANNVVSQNSNVSNYESFVVEVPTSSGISRRVLVSDGISTWPVVVSGARLPDYNRSLYNSVDKIDTGDYVVDQLHKFFSVYYRYGLLPGNDDGYGEKPRQTSGRGSTGSYGKSTAQIEYDARKPQVDAIMYATATQQNKVVTLSDILKSADYNNHLFYVPVDYYYGGATNNSAPRISQDAAVASAATQAATQAASDDDNNLMLYLGALGIIAVGYIVFKKKNKKKRK